MLSLYAQSKRRHAAIRSEAYAFVQQDAVRNASLPADLRIGDIDDGALAVWESTWARRQHPAGAGGWNWPVLLDSLPRRAAVLPAALWSGQDLCGLLLGRASRHRREGARHTITLTHVERRPEPPPSPLHGRVLLLAIAVAETYGGALGATRLRLGCPDPRLVGWYEQLGFSVARAGQKAVYCEREI